MTSASVSGVGSNFFQQKIQKHQMGERYVIDLVPNYT